MRLLTVLFGAFMLAACFGEPWTEYEKNAGEIRLAIFEGGQPEPMQGKGGTLKPSKLDDGSMKLSLQDHLGKEYVRYRVAIDEIGDTKSRVQVTFDGFGPQVQDEVGDMTAQKEAILAAGLSIMREHVAASIEKRPFDETKVDSEVQSIMIRKTIESQLRGEDL